jgi:hypothetical protein
MGEEFFSSTFQISGLKRPVDYIFVKNKVEVLSTILSDNWYGSSYRIICLFWRRSNSTVNGGNNEIEKKWKSQPHGRKLSK